ncbi:MAG: 3-ketoacyl-ACP reductase [Phycisphaera sp.]|nr:3-ketoacyl-ACP reductase [Phycisphaera sp.]
MPESSVLPRHAMVTGASRGIGRAIAVALGAQGVSVTIIYNSNAQAANECAALVEQAGGRATTVQADVGNLDDHGRLLDTAVSAFGAVELLVNNAGVAPKVRADILELGTESYDHVLHTNVRGPFFLTQRVARHMIELGTEGQVVNISSISAYTASVNRAEYCIAKAGLSMMTSLFAARLAEHGICVYEVRPGVIATDMTSGVKEKYDTMIEQGLTPIKRWGRPEDIASAVLAIAQRLLPFSTGEVLNVDGGFHLRRL